MTNTTFEDSLLPEKELHVVCVDDDVDFINSMSLVMPDKINAMMEGNSNLHFSFLTDPLEALELLNELRDMDEEIAMVVSDQKMPGMKGTEFLAKAMEIAPDAIRVLLTGYAGIDSAVEAINGKLLERYLTKPIEDENDFTISLCHMLNKYQMGQTISNQSKVLRDLYRFSNKLNAIEEYNEALNYIVDFTTSALRCERVSIMLYEEEPQPHLRIAAARGIPEDIIKTTRLNVGEGVAGNVFKKREAVYAKDITELGYVVESKDPDDALFISVPILWANLKSGEKPVGVINATNKRGEQNFSESDLELLTYISNTASIAINNLISSRKLKESYIETKTQAASMAHMMLHDEITSLPNRTSLDEKLRKLLATKRSSSSVTVVLMNLMRFREINCTIGHPSGDTLLRQISKRLSATIRKPGLLFHLGGDEFAIVLPNGSADDGKALASKIQDTFSAPINIDGINIDTSFYYGIAQYPQHATDHNQLVQKADVALSQAKQSGTKAAVYSSDSDQYNTRLLSMMNELKRAIEADQLDLYYQPKINLANGQLAGVEALVRWIHPEQGFIPPDSFIPLAEQMGLMGPLTEWVATRASKQCAHWQSIAGEKGKIDIAINLSTLNLEEEGFANKMRDLCSRSGIAPEQLNLEITESVIMGNPENALATLNQLSDMGFMIHLDDFGTGYSSLAYVKHLPISSIKIDRSFIMELDASSQGQDLQIVQSIIELAHSLELQVIAEGIENQEAETVLSEMGCDLVQGYFYSRPLPAQEFETWLQARAVS